MRKQSLFFVLIFCVAPGALASFNDDSYPERIVGVWELLKENGKEPVVPTILEFDKTQNAVFRFGPDRDLVGSGQFEISGKNLSVVITILGQKRKRILQIHSISDGSLRISDEESNILEFKKKMEPKR
jgi:hypothetical protein